MIPSLRTPSLLRGFGLLAVAFLGIACSSPESEAPAPVERSPVTVDLLELQTTAQPRIFQVTGTTLALSTVSPGTKILGRVESVLVREGEAVRKGDVLARLESRDLDAAIHQAEAGIAMAEAQLEQAETQHRRMESLQARGSATAKSLEDAVAALAVARAGVQQAEASRESALVTRSYADIRSPMDGWVVAKRIEPGDMATPGAPLFVIEDLSRIEIRAEVPESEIAGVDKGQEATVEILGRARTATVDRILPSADAGSRTFDVRLALEGDIEQLRSGMFARILFRGASEEVLLVPDSALVRRGGLVGVHVAEDHGNGLRARIHWIELGRRLEVDDAVQWVVLAGLDPGDVIVATPPAGLVDGTPLEVVR